MFSEELSKIGAVSSMAKTTDRRGFSATHVNDSFSLLQADGGIDKLCYNREAGAMCSQKPAEDREFPVS